MMSDENTDYLQPGFEPSTLTVLRLRSILVTYNIHYPSNAKKPELIELFNNQVVPQATKILARQARAKRSSMGIVDAAPASQSLSFGDDDDDDTHIRQQRRTSPRKRQARSTSHQPEPVPAQLPTASDTDTDADPWAVAASARKRTTPAPASAVRRTRAKTPQVKLEPPEEDVQLPPRLPSVPLSPAPPAAAWTPEQRSSSHDSATSYHQHKSSTDEDDVPFTSDNPFQSGSSPLAAVSAQAAAGGRRRTTPAPMKRSSVGGPAKADSVYARRRTADAAVSASASSSFTLVNPTTPAPDSDAEDAQSTDDALEPGEEFTPEAQLEMAQEEAAQREHTAASQRAGRRNKVIMAAAPRRRSIGAALVTPLWVLLLTLLGAYATWYRQEKLAVGYCGLGRLAVPLLAEPAERLLERLPEPVRETVAGIEVPPWLNVLLEPQCEPCPPHAFCYSDFSARCENGYLLKPHPLSLFGLVPLPPTCEPDGERARRVKAVADKAVEELRDRRAKWECGDLVESDGSAAASPAIDVPVLKEVIGAKRSKKMSQDEFDDLWTAAIGEIEARDEVEAEVEVAAPTHIAPDSGTVPNTRLSSTSLARLPLACAVRRSIRLGLARFRLPLSVLGLGLLAALYARARLRARRADRARVPALVDLALARLAAQKEMYLLDEEESDDAADDGAGGGVGTAGDDLRPDPFLFLPQLRDDVLRSTHSLAARERIWQHVRAVVEQNSNVRAGQREGRNGEIGRAWEWIGPVGTAVGAEEERSGSSRRSSVYFDRRRRRSGRVSLGQDVAASRRPVSAASTTPSVVASPAAVPRPQNDSAAQAPAEQTSALHRRWKESRPVY